MSWLHPAGSLRDGPDPLRLTPEHAGWSYCGLRVLALAPGEERTVSLGDTEGAVVPLSGSCRVSGPDFVFDLEGRSSVFAALTDVCYLPLGTDATVSSVGGGRFALATSVAEEVRPARHHRAADVAVEIRGAGQASRQINGLLSADVAGPQRLIVVEVITPAGNWSSYPPHKHDEATETETPLEEIYYFEVDGGAGFALHRTYTPDGTVDETVTVGAGDVFVIPHGYHGPTVAAPGYDLYYLNVMAGPDPERRWLICTDPDHAWLLEAWEGTTTDPRLPMYGEERS